MRLRFLVINGLVLGAIGWMFAVGSGEVEAAQLLPNKPGQGVSTDEMAKLESQAALAPSTGSVSALATAYLEREQPGLATTVIESAPPAVRSRPEIAQLYSRALFHGGHAREALAVAHTAQDACSDGCARWLLAKTTRQVDFLELVVASGVEDPAENPAAIRAAYDKSSREVRLVATR